MKHTPGPWKVDQLATKNDQQAFINIGGFTRIDILPDSVGFPPETIALSERDSWFEIREQIGIDEANANAKLIASAPDLLDACKSVLNSINDLSKDPTLDGCAMVLELAIRKATE